MIEYCKQFDDCNGCPDVHRDFCPGMVEKWRQEKHEAKEKKRSTFNSIIEEMGSLFKEIKSFNNDRYKLTLYNDIIFTYYPTTGTLINQKTKFVTNVQVYSFKRYFNFLK